MQGKVRIRIEGVMPERALLRLRRAEIKLFSVKKREKTAIEAIAWQKDLVKIFAIYPKVCYTIHTGSAYSVRVLGEVGVLKYFVWAKRRVGFLLGALCFAIGSLYTDTLVLGVELVGSNVYVRESLAVLEEHGIRVGLPYRKGKEDSVCSKLLSLRGVEFCSVQKSGLYVRVELRVSDEFPVPVRAGAYTVQHSGQILGMTVLSGTPLKTTGDTVQAGETLVGDYFVTPSGEQVKTEVVARAVIACTYEAIVEAEDEDCAFAVAYLLAGIGENDNLTEKSVTPANGGYAVKLSYTAVESFNL